MSNVDLVSKLVVFFTLRAVVPQADVLLGKPIDFRSFQSSLGLPIESLSLFSKKFFSYMRLIFALHNDLHTFLCQCEVLIFLNFLNNLLRTLIFSATSPSNHSVSFVLFTLT